MPVYSEVISDSKILSLIPQNCKSILIVACGACMNESLASKNDLPIFAFEESRTVPIASETEVLRLSNLLVNHGYHTSGRVLGSGTSLLCICNEVRATEIIEHATIPDLVLALCCKAGAVGLARQFSVPVISITETLGCLAYSYFDTEGKRLLVEDSAKIILF